MKDGVSVLLCYESQVQNASEDNANES